MSQIKAGDLVMVVRACCSAYIQGPVIFTVGFMRSLPDGICLYCGSQLPVGEHATGSGGVHRVGVPRGWLKRIPPLDELEREQERKELHA